MPTAPDGFQVSLFAEGLSDPRRMELAPNGDLFVAESRSGTIVVLWDQDGDGIAEGRETFASDLDRPFGLAFHGRHLYVGNNGAVVRFPYRTGQRRASGPAEHLVDLEPTHAARPSTSTIPTAGAIACSRGG